MKRIALLLFMVMASASWLHGQTCQTNFMVAGHGTNPLTIQFTNFSLISPSSGVVSWQWDFDYWGSTGIGSTVQHPSHTYPSAGTYLVCLTAQVTDSITGLGVCWDSTCYNITIGRSRNCNADFSWTTQGQSVSFTESTPPILPPARNNWFWRFGDGHTSNLQNPNHSYASPGTYIACLTYSTTQANGTHCGDTVCHQVTVQGGGTNCNAAFNWTSSGLNTSFNDQSTPPTVPPFGNNWFWTFGDGHSSTLQNPNHSYTSSGTYNVCMIFFASAVGGIPCSDTICHQVIVQSGAVNCQIAFLDSMSSPGTFQFFPYSSPSPIPAMAAWSWTFGDGGTSNQQYPTHTYAIPDTYNVCLVYSILDTAGNVICSDSTCHTVVFVGQHACNALFSFTTTGNTAAFANSSTSSPSLPRRTWSWDFGDGNTSTAQHPVHTYATAGTYNVCLTIFASSASGICRNTVCHQVTVQGGGTNCNAAFTWTSSGLNTSFNDQSTPSSMPPFGNNWFWSFGDGDSSTLQNPNHSYTSSGTYNVCLVFSTPTGGVLCVDSVCHQVTVQGSSTNCTVDFTINTSPGSLHAQLRNTSQPLTVPGTQRSAWAWLLSDGSTSSSMNFNHTFASTGTYGACLQMSIIDIASNTVLCTDRKCDTVIVDSQICQIAFVDSMSSPGTFHFFPYSSPSPAPGMATWSWTFGDGHSSSQQYPTHTYTSSGTYNVCVVYSTLNSAGNVTCTDSTCHTVTFAAQHTCDSDFNWNSVLGPVVNFRDASTSTGIISSWSWAFGDGHSSTVQNPIHTYTSGGTYNVCLTITVIQANGTVCTDTECHRVTVQGSTNCSADFTSSQGTSPLNIRFRNTSTPQTPPRPSPQYIDWLWYFGDGSTSTQHSPDHTYSSAGSYYACLYMTIIDSLTGNTVCFDSTCHNVTVVGSVNCHASFTTGPFGINPLGVQFTNASVPLVVSGLSWDWDFGDGNTSTSINPAHTYAAAGTYTVCLYMTLRDLGGNFLCGDTACRQITVPVGGVNCHASFVDSVLGAGAFLFIDTSSPIRPRGMATWSWTFGDGGTSSQQQPVHTYTSSGTYNVCLVYNTLDAAGNVTCTDSICHRVTVIGQQSCQADFTSNSVLGPVVNFRDASTSTGVISSWSWAFGDGHSSTVQNPIHTYASSGTYNVCLTITVIQANGTVCTDTECHRVTVQGSTNCSADFTSSQGTSPLNIRFRNTSTPQTPPRPSPQYIDWLWYFGDGSTSTQHSPDHTYSSAGSYYACLYMTIIDSLTGNTVCFDSTCHNVTVVGSVNCHASFTTGPFGINPLGVQFTNASVPLVVSGLSWDWDFGDGNTSTSINPAHTYATAGTYTVCLYMTLRDLGGNFLCADTACRQITVPVGGVNCHASFVDSVLGAGAFLFIDTSSPIRPRGMATWSWTFGDGGTSSQQQPMHTYTSSGVYNVCLVYSTLDPNGNVICADSICHRITVVLNSNCRANFTSRNGPNPNRVQFTNTSQPQAIPGTQRFDWHWSFGDGATSSQYSPDHTYTMAGTYTVCLYMAIIDIASNRIVCDDSICHRVTVGNQVQCNADFNWNLVPGLNIVAFTDRSTPANMPRSTWHWDFGDGNTSTVQSPAHAYANPGIYTVCLIFTTQQTGGICTDSICKTVVIPGNACHAAFSSRTQALTASFTDQSTPVTANARWRWSFGDGHNSTVQNPTHRYARAGTYQVCLIYTTVTASGVVCSDSVCHRVTVGGPSILCQANFRWTVLPINAVAFHNQSSPSNRNVTWQWNFGDGGTSTAQNPFHLYSSPGLYRVCLVMSYQSQGQSCTDSICKMVQVGPANVRCQADFNHHFLSTGDVALRNTSSPQAVIGTQILSWDWDFGDGHSSSQKDPRHLYANPGIYRVCLVMTITDLNQNVLCSDSICKAVVVPAGNLCRARFRSTHLGRGQVVFYGTAIGQFGPYRYSWTFGDGHSGRGQTVRHTYAQSGQYRVCLMISNALGCADTVYQMVTVNFPGGGQNSIGGLITKAQNPANNAQVYLITLNNQTGILAAADSTQTDSLGRYLFNNIQPGDYRIKAALDAADPDYSRFMPTYYVQSLHWSQANVITVFNSTFAAPIDLLPGRNPGGPGFIGGLISQGANKKGDPMPGVSILLFDAQDNAILHTVTDANGEYDFGNLAYGTYKVYVEIIGKTPAWQYVTIGASSSSISGIDFNVNSTYVAVKLDEQSFASSLKLAPNPVKDELVVRVDLLRAVNASIEVTDMMGRVVFSSKQQLNASQHQIKLNLSHLAAGMYQLRFKADNQTISRKLLKH